MGRRYAVGILALITLITFSFPLTSSCTISNDVHSDIGWDGVWNTSWTIMEYGEFQTYQFNMTIVQTDSTVVGTSDYHNWRLNGTVTGSNTLTGTWAADLPSGAPHTFGQVQLTLGPKGIDFEGVFKGEHHSEWDSRFQVYGVKLPGDNTNDSSGASQDGSDSTTYSPSKESSQESESPVIGAFEASPEAVNAGKTSTLTWNVMNATSVNISPDIGSVGMSGSIAISPVTTTDYTLTASNEYDTVIATISVAVLTSSISTELPVIHSFLANPQDINEGDTSSLSWSISNAYSFMISPNVFRQLDPIVITEDTPVNATVSPSVTTSYTLTAINDIGSVDKTIMITVYPQTTDNYDLNWSGTWDTNWGMMHLTQSLGKVTGTYDYQGGKIEVYISKNLSGNILVGTWSEDPSYAPPDDAGDIEFIMSSDSNSFTGSWRYGSEGDWYGDWNGTRLSP